MNTRLLKDTIGWGFLLWLIGYVLGFIFFAFVPQDMVGWFIMPIGIAIAVWVLLKKITAPRLQYYVLIAVVWTVIAIICDYLFLVLLLKPADGYYKLDVYLYYALTFVLPLLVGWRKRVTGTRSPSTSSE